MRAGLVLLLCLFAAVCICCECRSSKEQKEVLLTTELLNKAWSPEVDPDNAFTTDAFAETPIPKSPLSLYVSRDMKESRPSHARIKIDGRGKFHGYRAPFQVSVDADEKSNDAVLTVNYINSASGLDLAQLFSFVVAIYKWIQGKYGEKKWRLALLDVAHDGALDSEETVPGLNAVLLSPIFIFREGRTFYESKLARLLSGDTHNTITLVRSPPLPDGPKLCADPPLGGNSNEESESLSAPRKWRSCTNNDAMLWGKRTIAELTSMIDIDSESDFALEADSGPWDVSGMEAFAAVEKSARIVLAFLKEAKIPEDATVAGLLTKEFAREQPKSYLAVYMYIRYWLKVRRLWCFDSIPIDRTNILAYDFEQFEKAKKERSGEDGGGEEFLKRVGFAGEECQSEETDNSFTIFYGRK